MNLSIYDVDLRRVLIIGERFVSCLWSEGYNSSEPVTLELPDLPDYRQKIHPDMYIGRTDRPTLMLIQGVRAERDHLIVSGKQATRRLADLAFIGTIPAGSAVDTAIWQEYNKSRKIPHLEFRETALGVKYGSQISNKDFEVLAQTMCKATDCGVRVVRDGVQMAAEIYQPPDKNLIFAEAYGNIKIDSTSSGNANYKNYAIVLGAGEGAERTRQDVDMSGGADRRELIVDARDLQREKDESEDAYRQRLTARGAEKLLEHTEVGSIKVSPHADDFGRRYDLGDILHIRMDGGTVSARIVRFSQKAQHNQTSTTVEVGKLTR